MRHGALVKSVRSWIVLLAVLALLKGACAVRYDPATPEGACRREAFLHFQPVSALFMEAEPADAELSALFHRDHGEEAALYVATGWVPVDGPTGGRLKYWAVTCRDGRYYAELIGNSIY